MTAETPTKPPVRSRAKRSRLHEELGSQSWLENAALLVFLVYVAIAPLPYGQITQGGELTLELFAFTALAFLLCDTPKPSRLRGAQVTIGALLGIVALGVLQWLPLSSYVVGVLSPVSARVYADAGHMLEAFGRQAPASRISIAPLETLDTMLLTLAYIAFFVVGALILRSRSRRRLFAAVLISSAIIQIIVATVMRSVAAGTGEEPMAIGRLHGAFVNPNHFAGYLQIALFVGFGVLWREVLHYRESSVIPSRRPAQRFESLFMRISLRIVLWGVLAGGIALTESRGGILSAAIVTVVLLSIAPTHPRVRNRKWSYAAAGTGVVGAAVGLTLLAVSQQPILRFLSSDPRDPASDLRFHLWQLSLKAWPHFALFGSGLGTFREAFRRVQPHDFNYLVEFAHSDSLQLLVTGGLIGLALGATAVIAFLVSLFSRWRRELRREESAFMLASAGAILALLVHGLMEFNLSIPAIPATLACVAGFGWAATHGEDEEDERKQRTFVEGVG